MIRDALIHTLWAVGPMTTRQLAIIQATDRSHCGRSLAQLHAQHVVHQETWRGASVWSLTRTALADVARQQGYPASVGAWLRTSGYSAATRSHDLAVVEILVDLLRHSQPPRHGVVDWKGPGLAALEYARWSPEGTVVGVQLAPDAAVDYHWVGPDHREALPALIEYDTGTERLAIVERKAERYWAARHPGWFTLLLITRGGPARLERLLALFREALPDEIPVLGTLESAGRDWLSQRWFASVREPPVALPGVVQRLPAADGASFWGQRAVGRGPRDSHGRFVQQIFR